MAAELNGYRPGPGDVARAKSQVKPRAEILEVCSMCPCCSVWFIPGTTAACVDVAGASGPGPNCREADRYEKGRSDGRPECSANAWQHDKQTPTRECAAPGPSCEREPPPAPLILDPLPPREPRDLPWDYYILGSGNWLTNRAAQIACSTRGSRQQQGNHRGEATSVSARHFRSAISV